MNKIITAAAIPLLLAGHGAATAEESPAYWLKKGEQELKANLLQHPNSRRAKNVILFVGDGMGVSTVTAARILEGQLRGENGEENVLSFETLPYMGMSKTYNTNQQTPDSAGTMTAMMTGVKTKAGVIGLDQSVPRGDCAASKGQELTSFMAQMEKRGRATGIVSTARITHATPAATYAHSADRNWEDWSDMPVEAQEGGCKDIADQMINFPYGDGIDVAMGGGRRHFLPKDPAFNSGDQVSSTEGDRTDGRNLVEEWQAKNPNGVYVIEDDDFADIDTEKTKKLLGLFNESHMQYEADRETLDVLGEPSLSAMTATAIDVLNNNKKGFFLMVESGRIDHGHHAGNAYRALTDTIEFAKAVKTAMDKTNAKDTLIIVTADHSHVFTIAGYPTRGNPILGKVVGNDGAGAPKAEPQLAEDGLPYTTLGYTNGLGFANLPTGGDFRYDEPSATGRFDTSGIDTTGQGYHQEALVPLGSETHAGEDIAVYAGGPWAHLFNRTAEQSYVYQVMKFAAKPKKRGRAFGRDDD